MKSMAARQDDGARPARSFLCVLRAALRFGFIGRALVGDGGEGGGADGLHGM